MISNENDCYDSFHMKELIIEPKFRDLIPKLTDDEYAQLEKNILADGRVREPIVTWNNIIIDGHSRYSIVQKHPEIPFEIEQRDFDNEYEAMAWACDRQLERKNLSIRDKAYLIGREYESQKIAFGANYKDIGKSYNLGHATVGRYAHFSKGVDIADSIIPGLKDKILQGHRHKYPQVLIEGLDKVGSTQQKEIVEALVRGDNKAAKDIYYRYSVSLAGDNKRKAVCKVRRTRKPSQTVDMSVFEKRESEPYNANDLLEELRYAKKNLVMTLDPLFMNHADVAKTEEGWSNAITGLKEIDSEIHKWINTFNS